MPDVTKELQNVLDASWMKPAIQPRSQVIVPTFREPDPPESFKVRSFAGIWLNINPEKRGNSVYWYVDKTYKGKRHHLYVCRAGELTRARLEDVAKTIITG